MTARLIGQPAPALDVSRWFNADGPVLLENLRGRVVVIEAFQMLCPGCVAHGLPQAQRIQAHFPAMSVQVLGLHTVFEHHAAMLPVSLEAFLHEYRITFPVGVDTAGTGDLPKTMETYGLRGTPSLLLIDRNGHLRAAHFGQVSDLQIGAEIAMLLSELAGCTEDGCPVPATG